MATNSRTNAGRKKAVSLQNINLTLPGKAQPVHILKNVNLDIYAGEAVSIVGPSGSGKTSLMMVISGMEPATSGKVLLNGRDMTKATEDELALFRQTQMGVVFQSFHLIPTMTALENVMVPLELAGRNHARERAATLLKKVGMGERLDHFPAELSGGEQQRTALARAFAHEPAILMADEPTGNLDAETGQIVIEQMSRLQQEHNTTLVLITHDVALADACERKITLLDGRVEADVYRDDEASNAA